MVRFDRDGNVLPTGVYNNTYKGNTSASHPYFCSLYKDKKNQHVGVFSTIPLALAALEKEKRLLSDKPQPKHDHMEFYPCQQDESQHYATTVINGVETMIPGGPFASLGLASEALSKVRVAHGLGPNPSVASSSSASSLSNNPPLQITSNNRNQNQITTKPAINRQSECNSKKSKPPANPTNRNSISKKKRYDTNNVELPKGISFCKVSNRYKVYLPRKFKICAKHFRDFETAFRDLNERQFSCGLQPMPRVAMPRVASSAFKGGNGEKRKREVIPLIKGNTIKDNNDYTHFPSPPDSPIDFDEIAYKFVNKKRSEAGLPRLSFEAINGTGSV